MIVFDQRSSVFHEFRTRFSSTVAYPVEWMVDAPIRFVHWINANVTNQRKLIDENAQLRVQEILLQSRLQKLLALEKENAQLRQLLQSTPEIAGKVAVARILAVALDPNLQEMVLDRGSKDHVYNGQPVLDGFGVMGQVIGVGPLTSKILLLTDRRSAVPVEDYRNGARAIAVGSGVSGLLTLINVPNENDIKPGDLFVTSGLDMRFPVGYPVGMISKIKRYDDGRQEFILSPEAHLAETQQVLLAWPHKTELTEAVQQQLKASESGSGSGSVTNFQNKHIKK